MPNVFQATTGYRDPLKAMTLKALEARAKEAAAASAQAMQPQVIANPLQGAAQMVNVLGSKLQEGSALREAAAGRDQLARLQAGITDYGKIDPGTLAQIGVLDPETQRFLIERQLAIQNREDEQQFKAGESQAERDLRQALQNQQDALTVSEGALGRGSTEKVAALGQEGENTRQGIKIGADERAAEELAREQEAAAARKAQVDKIAARQAAQDELTKTGVQSGLRTVEEQQKTDIATGNIPKEVAAREAEAERLGLKRGTPEFDEYTLTGDYPSKGTQINNYTGAPGGKYTEVGESEAAKRHGEIIQNGYKSKEFAADIAQMERLGRAVGTGKLAPLLAELGGWGAALGIDVSSLTALPEAQAFQALADKLAPHMRVTGSGSSSDRDVSMFLSSLPSLSRTPEGNQIIVDTFKAMQEHRMEASRIVTEAAATVNPDGSRGLPWFEVDRRLAALKDPFEAFRAHTGGGGDGGADPNDPLGIGP